MRIDKTDGRIYYNDESHTYWDKDNRNYISVTSIIGNYTTFDEDFWSKYKALEHLMDENSFKKVKPRLLDKKIFDYGILEEFDINKETFKERVNIILNKWEKKRVESCKRGTSIHKRYENKVLQGKVPELSSYPIRSDHKIEPGKFVLPELLLSMDYKGLPVAGQADLVVINNYNVIILDYKTNEKIVKKSYFDYKKNKSVRMLPPLDRYDDVNYNHYMLQLSTYAYMIEHENPLMSIDGLYILHFGHNGSRTPYECRYVKSDVEKMLNHYRKNVAGRKTGNLPEV